MQSWHQEAFRCVHSFDRLQSSWNNTWRRNNNRKLFWTFRAIYFDKRRLAKYLADCSSRNHGTKWTVWIWLNCQSCSRPVSNKGNWNAQKLPKQYLDDLDVLKALIHVQASWARKERLTITRIPRSFDYAVGLAFRWSRDPLFLNFRGGKACRNAFGC